METSWTAAQLNRVLQARFGADRAGKFATADPTPRYKIVTLGDAGAGKSCLVRRYCERKFTASYIATIGIDYGLKAVALGPDHTVKINFWDMAGDRAYAVIRNEFYNDVHGIMLVIDVTHKDAAAHARKWMDEIRSRVVSLSTTPIVLAVNKIDQPDRTITPLEVITLAESLGIQSFECSAESGTGVDDAFHHLFRMADTQQQQQQQQQVAMTTKNMVGVDPEAGSPSQQPLSSPVKEP